MGLRSVGCLLAHYAQGTRGCLLGCKRMSVLSRFVKETVRAQSYCEHVVRQVEYLSRLSQPRLKGCIRRRTEAVRPAPLKTERMLSQTNALPSHRHRCLQAANASQLRVAHCHSSVSLISTPTILSRTGRVLDTVSILQRAK